MFTPGNPMNTPTPFSLLLVIIVVFFAVEAAGTFIKSYAARDTLNRDVSPMVNAPLSAARYRLDAAQSRFSVKAFAGGLLSAFAHDHNIAIKDFSGDITLTPDTVTPATLEMTIKSASLAVTDKVSDKDRQEIEKTMRSAVLEVEKYPNIVFKSTNISAEKSGDGQYNIQIWGDLTLHGVTRSIWFRATATVSGNGVRARGNFAIRQTDYQIKPPAVAGGTVKVKDELKFSFEIVAH